MNNATVRSTSFDDSWAFSRALSKSNVECMQTTSGRLQFDLIIISTPELELHLTALPVGRCIAIGGSADECVSFHVPLSNKRTLSLMGRVAEPDLFTTYPRGGELTVRAESGARLAYIVPHNEVFPELAQTLFEDESRLYSSHACRIAADRIELNRLKALLNEISQVVARSPAVFDSGATTRNIEQTLLRQLFAVTGIQRGEQPSLAKKYQLHRSIVKKSLEYLNYVSSEPVYVLDLCRALGISQPTLFRTFKQIFGIGPKEYLQLRRLHLARQRLLHNPDPRLRVHTVAYDLGFWHLGRFGRAYRELFGEMPSQTLRRSGQLSVDS